MKTAQEWADIFLNKHVVSTRGNEVREFIDEVQKASAWASLEALRRIKQIVDQRGNPDITIVRIQIELDKLKAFLE